MDKLQPIIKNRFWILAGLVLPLAMYGFFSANSKLKAATESRESDLKKAFDDIPPGTTAPNEEYAAGLAKINGVYSKTVDQSISRIWGTQQSRMTWPPVVETYRPRIFQGEFDYRGIVAYQEAYERLMLDLQTRVEPVMPLDKKSGSVGGRPMHQEEKADVPWKQKVILAASIPQAHFGRMRATSKEVWDAQIDIWLLRLLYDAVARLNEDKDTVTEAVLRRIDVLNLVGGDGEPVLTGGDSSGGGGGGYGGVGGDEMYEGMAAGGGGGGYGAESVGGKTTMPIAFNPAQEFGSDADTSGDGGDDSSASDSSYAGGMTTTMSRNSAKLRYIADEEDKPYLERGFYMSVIIMQNKIPDFLVELANSEWPVRVTRFHVGKNPYYTGATSNSSRFGGSSGGESSLYEEGMESYSSGGGGGAASYESESGFGGVGGNLPGIEGVGALTQNLPPMADTAMQHPNLVQLDLCGVITMYKQPQSIVDAIENGGGEKAVSAPGSEEIVPINDDSISDESGNAPLDPSSEESATPASPAATEPGSTPKTSTEPPAGSDTGTNPAPKEDSTNTLEPENL